MGIFSNLFKKKETVNNEVVNNVVEQSVPVVNEQVNQVIAEGTVGEAVAPVFVNEGFADTDPSNVLEKMQQNFVTESEIEAQNAEEAANSETIFNQKINLDESNPMSIFGVESEEKK